jgi:anti-anti-sigma factor
MHLRGLTRRLGATVVVELDGDADLAAIPQMRQVLTRALDTPEIDAVVVDLDGVTVLDDTALGQLIGAAATARRLDIRFGLVSTNERLRRRLADTRIDQIITVTDQVTGQSLP